MSLSQTYSCLMEDSGVMQLEQSLASAHDKRLYLLLSNTFSLVTRALGVYTGAPYNHVSIAFDEALDEMFSFGRRRLHNPLVGGFVHEGIDHGTFAYFRDTVCALYELPVTDEQFQGVRVAVRKFEQEQDRYRYNFVGLAGLAAGLPIDRKHSYFCSQFVAKVLEQGGISLFDKPPGLVVPPDFQTCDRLTLVYEGKLHEYKGRRPSSDVSQNGYVN